MPPVSRRVPTGYNFTSVIFREASRGYGAIDRRRVHDGHRAGVQQASKGGDGRRRAWVGIPQDNGVMVEAFPSRKPMAVWTVREPSCVQKDLRRAGTGAKSTMLVSLATACLPHRSPGECGPWPYPKIPVLRSPRSARLFPVVPPRFGRTPRSRHPHTLRAAPRVRRTHPRRASSAVRPAEGSDSSVRLRREV